MSKSTTGAYGDFPSYYYEKGNLFGAYLQGHTPAQSWDVRMEIEHLGKPAGPVKATRRRAHRRRIPRKPATTKLGAYVYRNLTAPATERVLAALSGGERAEGDAHERFDTWVAAHLTSTQQETVLVRLKLLALEAEKAQRRTRRRRPGGVGRSTPLTRREEKAPLPVSERRPKRASNPIPRVCALCSVELSDAERARSTRLRSIFLGQAYCTEHGDKFEALLSGGNTK